MTENKTSQVNLRLPPALKEAAEKAAAKDFRSLTSLIEKLLSDYLNPKPALNNWHKCAYERFVNVLAEKGLPVDISKKCRIFSYFISFTGEKLNPSNLTKELQRVYQEESKFITNPHLFYPYPRSEISPYFTSDNNLKNGSAEEILECSVFSDSAILQGTTEFWRVSSSGFATYIRSYLEDRQEVSQWGWEPGKKFCPFFLTRDLAEIVLHAFLLSRIFSSPHSVEFQCEALGLFEREIADPDPSIYWHPGKVSKVDHRLTTYECSADSLRDKWPEAVSALGWPVMRLFSPTIDFSSDWVRAQSQRFKR